MLTYVLDASAYLRLLHRQAGWVRVQQIIDEHLSDSARVTISAVQWGEIVKIITRREGPKTVEMVANDFADFQIEIVAATAKQAEKNALIDLKYNIAYADAFGIELASDSPNHILITADYGVKPAERDIRIEFLPTKPKP